MEIKLSDIPDKGLTIEAEIPPEDMSIREVSFSINNPFEIHLFLQIVDGVFIAKGSYNGIVDFICDRCLKVFSRNPSNSSYIFALEISSIEGETIDLTDGIREDTLLSLPIKVLCSEDCKGICPYCGINRNVEKCECEKPPGAASFLELDKLF